MNPKLLALFAAPIILSACNTTPSDITTKPSPPPNTPGNSSGVRVIGNDIQVTLSGIGTQQLSVNAAQLGNRTAVKALALSNSSFAISSGNAAVSVRSSTDIIPLGGTRSSGFRYLHATVRFTNNGSVPLSNLIFVGSAVGTAQTAIAGLERYPGLPEYTTTETTAIALGSRPTSPVTLEPRSLQPALVPGEEDALQIFTEAELVGLSDRLLPYGFVAHSGSSRTIQVGDTGTFTVAMRVPLQPLSKDDPYSVTLQLTAIENSETNVTESLEAQLPINQAAFNAALTRIGGSLRVMPGTAQTIGKAICQVRTAGTASSATDYLVNRVPTGVALLTRVITKGQTLALETRVSDASGTFYLPVQLALTDPSLATVNGRQLTAVNPGTTAAAVSACGISSSLMGELRVLQSQTISANLFYSLALKSDGVISAWGSNLTGQTNLPSNLTGVVALSAGGDHSLALKSDGTVSAWGSNEFGQTNVPSDLTGVVAIGAGAYHSLALKSDGTVSVWGSNNDGQRNVPSNLTGIVAISAGAFHSLALKSDGTVSAWGFNDNGQTNVPSNLTGVTDIGAGGLHSLALKSDGTVIAWGDNRNGQTNVPSGLTGVTAISAGEFHSLALKSDGTVSAWGFNDNGQTDVPSNLTGVVAISAGGFHSLALKSDGAISAWGLNGDGQTTVPIIAPLTFKLP